MTRYRAKDGRELFISDGDSKGQEWAIYYQTLSGEIKRACVLQPDPCQNKWFAERLLSIYARDFQFTILNS